MDFAAFGEAVLKPEDEQLDSLFEQWLLESDGEPRSSLESFCKEFPDLLIPLRERIDRLERMESQLDRLGKQARGECDADQISTEVRPQEPHHHPDDTLSGLSVRCPFCRQLLQISPEADLAHIKCLNCGEQFAIAGDAVQPEPTKPQLISQFELLEMVGMGGFGSVWKAKDRELDRTVAIKLSRRGTLTRDDVERVFREARSAAQLRHPNIVSVYEVGQDGETFFIVSEFVEGQSLAQAMKARLLPLREAVTLCVTIARALDHAHERGVVHRDLKPHNIMLDREGSPHLLDFGLAKRDRGELTMTFEGDILGTPAYMSPEQAKGEGHLANRAADVYSLGVILFELFTGSVPFRGGVHAVLKQIIEDEPPAPRRLESRLPRDLQTICLRCLEKSPAKRYQTAEAIAVDLENWLHNRPVNARPITAAERAWRWVQRHPAIASLTAAVILVLAVGLATVSYQLVLNQRALRETTRAQVDMLINASPRATPSLVARLPTDQPALRESLERCEGDAELTELQRNRARLALLPHRPELLESVFEALLESPIDEALAIRDSLGERRPDAARLAEELLATHDIDDPRLMLHSAACLLEDQLARDHAVWPRVAKQLVRQAVERPGDYGTLCELFHHVEGQLTPAIQKRSLDAASPESVRSVATRFLGDFAEMTPDDLVFHLVRSEPWQFSILFPAARRLDADAVREQLAAVVETTSPDGKHLADMASLAKRRAQALVAQLRLGVESPNISLLDEVADQSARRYFVERHRECGGRPEELLALLDDDLSRVAEAIVLLAIGQFERTSLSPAARSVADEALRLAFQNRDSLGLHEAAGWVMRRWRIKPPASDGEEGDRAWLTTSDGHTLAVVEPTIFVGGGLPGDETDDLWERRLGRYELNRRYAIATRETTIAQYQKAVPAWRPAPQDRGDPDTPRRPVYLINWQQAASYCNWLSKREGIPSDQWCYVKAENGLFVAAPDALDRTGFRMPLEEEWEGACRAGSQTPRFFGWTADLLSDYAVVPANSPWGQKQPVGGKMPNDWGLFDTYGNVDEVCHELRGGKVVVCGGAAGDVKIPSSAIFNTAENNPDQGDTAMGFRIARTLPPDTP